MWGRVFDYEYPGSGYMKLLRIKGPSALSVRNFQNKRTAGFLVFAEKSGSKNHQFQGFQILQRTSGLHERLSGYRQIFDFFLKFENHDYIYNNGFSFNFLILMVISILGIKKNHNHDYQL
jgi:hypothetical protein